MHGQQGRCPHCDLPSFFPKATMHLTPDRSEASVRYSHHHDDVSYLLEPHHCANCGKLLVYLTGPYAKAPPHPSPSRIFPGAQSARKPAEQATPAVKALYSEAANVEPHSERAAAALARACLQVALRHQGFGGGTLEAEIERAQADRRCLSTLVEKLQLVRVVGNYALHATQGADGTWLSVEPGEIDALFAALDEFIDVFYVRPKRHEATLAQVNKKLSSAGKPEIGKPKP